jgi:outer membrane protein, multidrug efflux system
MRARTDMRDAGVPTVAILAAAILTSGCLMGANYERPEMRTPAAYRFVNAEQAQTAATLPWFDIFADPTLGKLIHEAMAANLDLRTAFARVEEARARAGIAASFLYPQIDGGASWGVRQASRTQEDADTTHNSFSYGFRLSWEIDLFGRLRREREAATAFAFATEQARRGVMVTLVGDVAANYFLLRELDRQLLISRETLRLNDESVRYFRDRLDGGVSNRLELDRIQANRSRTAAAVPEIEQRIALIEHELSLLLGRLPGGIEREPLAAEDPLPPDIPAGLPVSLLERRPDVLQAEQLLVAANADVGAAKAMFFPSISLGGFLGGITGDVTQFLGGEGAVWSLSTGLLQPIYQGGRIRRNLEAQQARMEAALAQYQKAALNGYREVSNSLVTIQKLADQRVARQAGVTALLDAVDLARSRYDSGLASYLEILTADEALFEQQLLLAQTRGAELRARSELYRSLGGGWEMQ